MAPLSWAELQKIIVPREVPTSEEYRWYAGANVTPQRIQEVLRQAECGYMAPLTDLEDEMLMLDAHGAAVAQKRMAALQSLPWSVTAAKGEGIDDGLAEEIADATRRMYECIPAFDDAVYNQAWGTFHARACHEIHWDTYPRRPHFRPRELQWIKARRLSFGPARQLLIVEPWLDPSGFQTRGIDTTAWPCHFWTFTPKLFGEYQEKEGIGPRMLYWMLFKRLDWRWRMLLLEIFALPWRIVKARYDANGNSMASADQVEAAAKKVQRLGLDSTAWLPPGIDLDVVTLDAASTDLFQTTGSDADLQLSKIALGNTATTEGNESNRANSIVQLGAEELLNAKDASGMSGSINRDIGIPFTGLNYGWDKLDHAAVFKIKAEPARDTTKELEHADKLLGMGAPIALNQLYEVSGWRAPNEEPYVVRGGDGAARVVDPAAEAEKQAASSDQGGVPAIPLTPTDIATIVTVNIALASLGLPPLTKPDGTPDPDGYLTVAAFQAKNATSIAEANAAKSGETGPEPSADAPTSPEAKPEPGNVDDAAAAAGDLEEGGVDQAEQNAAADALCRALDDVCRLGVDIGNVYLKHGESRREALSLVRSRFGTHEMGFQLGDEPECLGEPGTARRRDFETARARYLDRSPIWTPPAPGEPARPFLGWT